MRAGGCYLAGEGEGGCGCYLALAADKVMLLQWEMRVGGCYLSGEAEAGAIVPWLLTSSCTCSGE